MTKYKFVQQSLYFNRKLFKEKIRTISIHGDPHGGQSVDGPNRIVLVREILLQEVPDERGKPIGKQDSLEDQARLYDSSQSPNNLT